MSNVRDWVMLALVLVTVSAVAWGIQQRNHAHARGLALVAAAVQPTNAPSVPDTNCVTQQDLDNAIDAAAFEDKVYNGWKYR